MTDLSKPLTVEELDGIADLFERTRGLTTPSAKAVYAVEVIKQVPRLLAMARSSLSGIEAEPVAWRYRHKSQPHIDYLFYTGKDPSDDPYLDVQPLYLSPPTKGGEGRELVEAAKPFAAVADVYAPQEDDSHQIWKDWDPLDKTFRALTVGACRRLRAAIASTEGK